MTDKITIKGTAPKYDEQVLKQRQTARQNAYNSTDECAALVRGDIAIQFLNNVIDYHIKGYTLSTKYPVTLGYDNYSCRMVKPDVIQQAERGALDAQMKQDYVADLEREREQYKQLLTAQLLQTRQLAEAKKIADKQAKVLAEIEREVADTFGKLIIPD